MERTQTRIIALIIIGAGLAAIIMYFWLNAAGNGQRSGLRSDNTAISPLLPDTGGVGTTTATSTATTTRAISTSMTSPNKSATPPSNQDQSRTSTNSTLSQPITAANTSGIYYVFVEPDAYYKVPGSTVVFYGSHFWPGETVNIVSDEGQIGTVIADAHGRFVSSALSISYTSDEKQYVFTGATSGIPFKVNITIGPAIPWITLSSYYAGAGTPISIRGRAFGSNENINIIFDGTFVGTTQTDAAGNFIFETLVPYGGRGQKVIRAMGVQSGVSDTESFSQAY